MTNDDRVDGFQDALDRRGPAIELWPPAERAAAATLLVTSAAAQRLHGEAERLQRLLGQALETAPVRPGAVGRILAGIDTRRGISLINPLRTAARPRAAFALTLIAASMFALGALRGADIAASLGGDDSDFSYAMVSGADSLPAVFEGN
jgi:hypothetical protein